MPELTLKECIAQPQGIDGRLFDLPEDDIEAWKSFKQRVPKGRVYRVLSKNEIEMEIEAYILGGSKKIVSKIPIAERERDIVLDSDFLLYNYIVTGRAGSNPQTASLCVL